MIRGSITKKIILSFLFFIAMVFVLINFPFKMYLKEKAEENEIRDIKNAGAYMVEGYVNSATAGEPIAQDKFRELLKTAEYFTGFRFWVVSVEGTLLIDTATDENNGKIITEIKKDYLEQTLIKGETLDGLLEDDCISVICPMNYDYQTRGYLIVHGNYRLVEEKTEESIFWANIVASIVSLVLFVVAVVHAMIYAAGMNKLTLLTVSYKDGKFGDRAKMYYSDEHQKLANAIMCLADKTEGLIEYQKNFIANVSHDFRSPLTSIKGYTAAMKDGVIPPEAQGKYLDIILFETERLTGLTRNLLELNEFDNKGIRLEMTDFNICDMVRQSAATFEAKCAEKKLKVRLVFADKEIWVKADKSRIQQVLHNLIDNAIKFSEEGGMIVVTVSEMPNRAMVSVKDNGIGIPKESINQIWERFYKTDLSRGKDKKGTGLGLSITRQIINAHGENIMVNSKVGEGTEFKFTLSRVAKP